MIEPRMYIKKCFSDLVVKYGSIFGKDKTMTNKQVIIDGIDVSGCTHKKNDACMAITDLSGDFCHYCNEEIMKDCYYKQLKRKEQECEELKEKYLELKEQNGSNIVQLNTVNEQLDQLKAKNEQLKKQACGLRPELKYIIDKTCSKYNINAKYYHEKIVEIINNLDKYKQTLTEIKEIIHFNKTNRLSGGAYISIEQILQKISECETK